MTTNYEQIKAMSIDEMAEFLESCVDDGCTNCCMKWEKGCYTRCTERIKQWLSQEVKE